MPAAGIVRAAYPFAITDHSVSQRVRLLVEEDVNEVTRDDIETQVD